MPSPRSHFVTGFPGFIGRRLVAKLLADDASARVVVLVEERMRDAGEACAEKIGGDGRIEIVTGDITDRRLGLDDATYERVARSTTMVFHLAAIYNLAVPLEVATRINVDGTGNVVDF